MGKLLPARAVREMFGDVSQMTLWRWLNDDSLGFPRPVYIRGRRFFDATEVEAFKIKAARKGVAA